MMLSRSIVPAFIRSSFLGRLCVCWWANWKRFDSVNRFEQPSVVDFFLLLKKKRSARLLLPLVLFAMVNCTTVIITNGRTVAALLLLPSATVSLFTQPACCCVGPGWSSCWHSNHPRRMWMERGQSVNSRREMSPSQSSFLFCWSFQNLFVQTSFDSILKVCVCTIAAPRCVAEDTFVWISSGL